MRKSRVAGRHSRAPVRLTPPRISTLAHLCMLPFIETGELSVLSGMPPASVHQNLQRLRFSELARRIPHSLDSARRTYRWIPTAAGVRALSDREIASEADVRDAVHITGEWIPLEDLVRAGRALDVGRATAQWHRLMSGRLDILACVYRMLCAVRSVEDGPPAAFRLYRSIPFDAAVRLSDGRCYGIIVKRPAFGGPQFGKRLANARAAALQLCATFIVTPDRETVRETAAEADRPGRMRDIATAVVPACVADDPDVSACAEPETPENLFSLRRLLEVWTVPGRMPDETPAVRRRPPDDDMEMPPYLGMGAKKVLHSIGDWPLATPPTLAAISDMSEHWLQKCLAELRRHGLARSLRVNGRSRLALTDDGIKTISAASRTGPREHVRHWSSELRPDGEYVGGTIRQLLRETGHNDMAHDFVASLSQCHAEAKRAEVRKLLPAHLGMKFFRYNRRGTYSIRPDATTVVTVEGRRHVLLLEVERRAVYPKSMSERLMPYLRYFSGRQWAKDYGQKPRVLVVLEDARIESRFLDSQEAAGLSRLPVMTGNSADLERLGPYGRAWRRLSTPAGERVAFWSR